MHDEYNLDLPRSLLLSFLNAVPPPISFVDAMRTIRGYPGRGADTQAFLLRGRNAKCKRKRGGARTSSAVSAGIRNVMMGWDGNGERGEFDRPPSSNRSIFGCKLKDEENIC